MKTKRTTAVNLEEYHGDSVNGVYLKLFNGLYFFVSHVIYTEYQLAQWA